MSGTENCQGGLNDSFSVKQINADRSRRFRYGGKAFTKAKISKNKANDKSVGPGQNSGLEGPVHSRNSLHVQFYRQFIRHELYLSIADVCVSEE